MFARRIRRYILTADVSVIITFIDARFGGFRIRFDFGQNCVLVYNIWKLFIAHPCYLRLNMLCTWIARELNLFLFGKFDIISLIVFLKCCNYQHFPPNVIFVNRIYPNISARIIILPNIWYQILITNNLEL